MTHFAEYFQKWHTSPRSWLDLGSQLLRARSELPKADFQPSILRRGGESKEESVKRSLREIFERFSGEIAAAAGERFQDGQWPEKLSAEAAYFLHVILTSAMQAVAYVAPTPDRPLKATIVPFPDAPVSEVALWFCTEWWLATGGQIFAVEMAKRQNPSLNPTIDQSSY